VCVIYGNMDNINILFTFVFTVGYDKTLPTRKNSPGAPREFPVGSPKLLWLSLNSRPPPRMSHLTILALFHTRFFVPCRKFSHNAVTAQLLSLFVYFKPFTSNRFTFFPSHQASNRTSNLQRRMDSLGSSRDHKLLLFL
jgi:hypothetical protein